MIKNIPAVTIVAEWSKALTGVGPAIASAIQPENGKFVDLVKAAKIIEELKPEIIIIATLDISYYKKTIHKLEKHIKNKCEVIFPTLQKPFIRKYSKILLNEK